jgi:trimeric autotransporter adhesin
MIMTRISHTITALLLGACGTLALHAQPAAKTATAVPRLVKFNSTLTDGGGKPLTGIVGVTFSLYETPEGGVALWTETQNVQPGGNGQFTVLLGSTSNAGIPAEAFASGERWLAIQAQGEPERPRVLMTSVPYSLKAVDAETLGGLPASAFALAGTANPAAAGAGIAESPAGPAKPLHPSAAPTPEQTGSGTTNFITIWTAATTLGNSKLYQTAAGNVGLGTTAPTARFEAISTGATGIGVLGDASSATGANFGVFGKSASTAGTGVQGSAGAASGTTFGVVGSAASPAGTAVYGINSAATGNANGVFGTTASTTGIAVQGSATATTGINTGVFGFTPSTSGVGVIGQATAATGTVYGVYGSTVSPTGISVYGLATEGTGVAGQTASPTAYGVYAVNSATTGNAFGAYGVSASPTGYGVFGTNTATTGHAFGVYGTNASTAGTGVLGANTSATGSTFGVYGSVVSPNGVAVEGVATSGSGVAGQTTSPSGYGVYAVNSATTGSAFGLSAQSASTAGVGVQGVATASSGTTYGVYGAALSATGIGVYGSAPAGGFAGEFNGNVSITGNLAVSGTVSKGGGSFRIDHPLDPEHKYLYHSFVESPDMMNIYNGVVTLSKHGDAVVKLPEWFDALNRDFRYQLTCIGGFAPVYVASEVSGNQFKIGGGRPGMKISWQVTGIRKDAFANEHRIPVEEDK